MIVPEGMQASASEVHRYDYRDSARYWNVVTQATCLAISTILVWMRMYSKLLITKAPGWEDFCCVLAWMGLVAYVVITFEADKYGNGIHIWEVDESDLQRYSKWANTSQIIYGPLIFITKLSVILLYLRVFAPSFRSKTFLCIHALIWLNLGFYFADTIVKIFECSPRAKIWDKTLKGHCININIPIIVTSSINVASDFLILVLPIVSVWRLQMRNSKKWGTSAIFAAGIFACMCSIMRLVVSVRNKTVKDKTYDWFPEFLWTSAEVTSGIIASCMPALPTFFRHFFNRARALISSASTSYSSRAAKKAIEVISWPASRSVRQKTQSSGGLSMTELCRSTNCELDDIEQQPEEHTGSIFSGAGYTTAGAQVGILGLPKVVSDSYTSESRGAEHGSGYRSGILKTVEVDVESQRG
ncbi:hypothetical protein IFM61606_03816 [Aspergillus udagawae]|uniref:Rhodopsin domain-containing protein n=1 Tax=Aspergillus udagawae TaxID=91492 RepID=A0ABQ1A8U7_9EURO|nr:hypothetical protein IFM53868_01819 [Aspergillus udagawae]GFG03440.1 hypothetical protein IFM5058_01425 [Aspergillus udagawae]GFG23922.1 hypothetical protein IFM61606_03816 [Aspergillus udagawae]